MEQWIKHSAVNLKDPGSNPSEVKKLSSDKQKPSVTRKPQKKNESCSSNHVKIMNKIKHVRIFMPLDGAKRIFLMSRYDLPSI